VLAPVVDHLPVIGAEVPPSHRQIRPADFRLRPHRLDGVVDRIVHRGEAHHVSAALGPIAFEFIPDLKILYIRIAQRHRTAQVRKVLDVLVGHPILHVPVLAAGLHPARRRAEGNDRNGIGHGANEIQTAIEARPTVNAGRRLRIVGAPAHDVLVLVADSGLLQPLLYPAHSIRVATLPHGVGMGDADLQLADHGGGLVVNGNRDILGRLIRR
jgi:hypothetical protein